MNAIFTRLHIQNSRLRLFLLKAQEAFRNGDIVAADDLIVDREIWLKGKNRAKTLRAGEYAGQSWIGIDRLDYRFTSAKRIIQDIMNAEIV